jgi:tetratricopeptide (TPR) repeat protein
MQTSRIFGHLLFSLAVILPACSDVFPQDETLAEIKYKEDYDRLQKIAPVSQPVKRAGLLLTFYKERPDLDPKLRDYADNLFARDLEALMKQNNTVALKGLCEKAVQVRPKFGEAYFFYGVVLRKEKKIEEAMNALAKSYLIRNPLQKKAKELLDTTYRSYNNGSMIGQDKIIKQARQELK